MESEIIIKKGDVIKGKEEKLYLCILSDKDYVVFCRYLKYRGSRGTEIKIDDSFVKFNSKWQVGDYNIVENIETNK